MSRPKFDNYKDYMRWRLDKRVQTIQSRVNKVKRRYIDLLPDGVDSGGESDRLWLDQFAKGNGLDICCGDFLIGEDEQAIGVDGNEKQLGCDVWSEGDELAFQEPGRLDYIVTNYLDGLPNPLKALNEWYRTLRDGGVLAVIVRDADTYIRPKGPLDNPRRQSSFTQKTLGHYIYRAGFQTSTVEKHAPTNVLRAVATK